MYSTALYMLTVVERKFNQSWGKKSPEIQHLQYSQKDILEKVKRH